MKRLLPLLPLLLLVACSEDYDPGLNQMAEQPHLRRWEATPLLPDGSALQPPVPGTVSREEALPDPARSARTSDGAWRSSLPWPMDRQDLEIGRRIFNQTCATCHGLLGDGDSYVAERMRLVPPRNLHEPAIRDAAPGYIFEVISEGYGMMASYAADLTVAERWQVVAYLQVLQWSRVVPLQELPAQPRSRIEEELP